MHEDVLCQFIQVFHHKDYYGWVIMLIAMVMAMTVSKMTMAAMGMTWC
jgi:hypothetical protein